MFFHCSFFHLNVWFEAQLLFSVTRSFSTFGLHAAIIFITHSQLITWTEKVAGNKGKRNAKDQSVKLPRTWNKIKNSVGQYYFSLLNVFICVCECIRIMYMVLSVIINYKILKKHLHDEKSIEMLLCLGSFVIYWFLCLLHLLFLLWFDNAWYLL